METKNLVWQINAELHQKFKALCAERNVTMTKAIHEAIGYYVDVRGNLREVK
jgi:uncharacterized protein YdbL (DUF1318 family)